MGNNLKYFSHDVGSHRSWKFKLLRSKYGWEGDAKFWVLNSLIAEADDCRLDLKRENMRKEYAAELEFTLNEFDSYIEFLNKECDLLNFENPFTIWTDRVDEIFNSVKKRRERNNRSYRKGKLSDARTSELRIEPSEKTKMEPIIQKGLNALAEFYGFNEIANFRQLADISSFLFQINKKGLMKHFRQQFKFYRLYKEETKERIHGYKSFLNPKEVESGAWNTTNWKKKYEELTGETDIIKAPKIG